MREKESEIYARAIEYTAFTSCIQTHGDVRHLYEMTEETQKIARLYTDLHGALLPYIQKLSRDACESGMPVVRHLVLNYPKDENVYGINDEFMLGNGLNVLEYATNSFSFYSGHSANSFGLATCSVIGFRLDKRLEYKGYTTWMFFWATMVAVSRIFVGKHYLGDIIVGAIAGAAIGWTMAQVGKLIIRRFIK
jgi:hypothetical protein